MQSRQLYNHNVTTKRNQQPFIYCTVHLYQTEESTLNLNISYKSLVFFPPSTTIKPYIKSYTFIISLRNTAASVSANHLLPILLPICTTTLVHTVLYQRHRLLPTHTLKYPPSPTPNHPLPHLIQPLPLPILTVTSTLHPIPCRLTVHTVHQKVLTQPALPHLHIAFVPTIFSFSFEPPTPTSIHTVASYCSIPTTVRYHPTLSTVSSNPLSNTISYQCPSITLPSGTSFFIYKLLSHF